MKVLIATDVHLGHRFNDPIRKNDSFQAFEQVLSIASKNQVDFVLLGGDLYDVRNPNKQILSKSFQIINKYIYGQTQSLQTTLSISNYQPQPNYQYRSIKFQFFRFMATTITPMTTKTYFRYTIQSKKQDQSNYFGKHLKTGTNIIKPILFQKTNQKGEKIKLALYGVGYIKDCVLNQMHQKGLIIFEPVEEKEDTFCLFIHHQNRCPGKKYSPNNNFVNPKYIPEWMDLTIWGHYHQPKQQYRISRFDNNYIFHKRRNLCEASAFNRGLPKQSNRIEKLPSHSILSTYESHCIQNVVVDSQTQNLVSQLKIQLDYQKNISDSIVLKPDK